MKVRLAVGIGLVLLLGSIVGCSGDSAGGAYRYLPDDECAAATPTSDLRILAQNLNGPGDFFITGEELPIFVMRSPIQGSLAGYPVFGGQENIPTIRAGVAVFMSSTGTSWTPVEFDPGPNSHVWGLLPPEGPPSHPDIQYSRICPDALGSKDFTIDVPPGTGPAHFAGLIWTSESTHLEGSSSPGSGSPLGTTDWWSSIPASPGVA